MTWLRVGASAFLLLATLVRLPLYSTDNLTSSRPEPYRRTDIGDFDHNGRSDAVFLRHRHVYVELGPRARMVFRTDERTVSVVAADIDHDGDTDVVVLLKSGRLQVLSNNGQGRFSSRTTAARNGHEFETRWTRLPVWEWNWPDRGLTVSTSPNPPPSLTALGAAPADARSSHLNARVEFRPLESDPHASPSRAPPSISLS
jgi:hypothetical protein